MPGVYLFKNAAGEIIYIGKAKNLRVRVGSYFRTKNLLPKTQILVSQIESLDHIAAESEIDALILEATLIRKHRPKYNSSLKDDKAYPLIEISHSQIPLVRIVRRETDPKARYFGPFPVGSEVSGLLRYLRRVFPFVSQVHQKNRPCFRAHLGLCPCRQIFSGPDGLKKYRQDLKRLADFLSGKRGEVQKKLEKDMLQLAKEEDFSKAKDIKDKLERISWLTAQRRRPFEYELNPSLVDDRRAEEVNELEKLLGISPINRIECYDISNTSGRQGTGAMVVFTGGVADKKEYRRFRIKIKKGPDDPAMISEVFSRRFKRRGKGWTLPDLIVIDGGATQLQAGRMVLAGYGLKIPTVALAKREEEVYLEPQIRFKVPQGPALLLLQKIRDEAHRFSRKYHFLLRKKNMLGLE